MFPLMSWDAVWIGVREKASDTGMCGPSGHGEVVSSTDTGSPHQITKSTVHASQVRVGQGPGPRMRTRCAGTRQMEPGCGLGAG